MESAPALAATAAAEPFPVGLSPKEHLSAILEDYQRALQKLFQSLQFPFDRNSEHASVAATQELLAVDAKLKRALDYVEFHQRFQQKIDTLKNAVSRYDRDVLEMTKSLHSTAESLELLLDRGRERLASLQRASENPLPIEEVIAYANRISGTTSAPPLWNPHLSLQHYNHRPPRPEDADISEGLLYARNIERGGWKVGFSAPAVSTETQSKEAIDVSLSHRVQAQSVVPALPVESKESKRLLLSLDI